MMHAYYMGGYNSLLPFMHLFCLLLLVGLVLFAIWAVKYLSKEKLKMVAISFFLVGLIGALVIGLASKSMPGNKDWDESHKVRFATMMGDENFKKMYESMMKDKEEKVEKPETTTQ